MYDYIRRNFHHGVQHKRNMILQAVTGAMRETFTEDNIVTRYSALIDWLLENDDEYQKLINESPEFKSTMNCVLLESVQENFSKKVAKNP